jgi:hypothetical protein
MAAVEAVFVVVAAILAVALLLAVWNDKLVKRLVRVDKAMEDILYPFLFLLLLLLLLDTCIRKECSIEVVQY